MKKQTIMLLSGLLLLAAPVFAAVDLAPLKFTPSKYDASTGVLKPGKTQRFLELHRQFLERAKSGPVGLLFIGDSITERWKNAPDVWERYYGKYQPANFGIGGDSTQHVIWRIEHGELDHVSPKVVVLMIGTNNTATHTAEQIAAADRKIVGMIRQRLPETRVLLLAIFPRGPQTHKDKGFYDDGVRRMEIIRAVNADLARLDDGDRVRFLDIGPRFLGPDGKIPDDVLQDQLHPTPKGYEIWAEAMQPLLTEMMAEK